MVIDGNRRDLGYGYVSFAGKTAAEAAVHVVDRKLLGSHRIRVATFKLTRERVARSARAQPEKMATGEQERRICRELPAMRDGILPIGHMQYTERGSVQCL